METPKATKIPWQYPEEKPVDQELQKVTGKSLSIISTGELNKATIYAIIKAAPSGQGTFIGFDKGSTSRSQG